MRVPSCARDCALCNAVSRTHMNGQSYAMPAVTWLTCSTTATNMKDATNASGSFAQHAPKCTRRARAMRRGRISSADGGSALSKKSASGSKKCSKTSLYLRHSRARCTPASQSISHREPLFECCSLMAAMTLENASFGSPNSISRAYSLKSRRDMVVLALRRAAAAPRFR